MLPGIREGDIISQDSIPPLGIIRATVNKIRKSALVELIVRLQSFGAGAIIALCFLIVILNIHQDISYNQDFIETSIDDTKLIVATISTYTPGIDEDLNQLEVAINGSDKTYIERPSLADSLKSPVHYTVQ